MSGAAGDRVRLDRWLWAARFFKTRGLAQQAIAGGRVELNGARVKPAHALRAGDRLAIRRGDERFVVTVVALAERRGPASVARGLSAEDAASVAARAEAAEQRRMVTVERRHGRPTKRERRQIDRLQRDS